MAFCIRRRNRLQKMLIFWLKKTSIPICNWNVEHELPAVSALPSI